MSKDLEDQLSSFLKEAYPAVEPSESLEQRLDRVDASATAQSRRKSARTPRFRKLLFIFALPAFAVMAIAAIKYLMGRPGEAAIQLIPADADVIATLDTNPSEQQLFAFERINDALNREHLGGKVDELAGKQLDKSPLAQEIRPYVSKNFAFAGWKSDEMFDSPDPAIFLSLTDAPEVASLLQNGALPTGIPGLYQLKEKELYGGVIEQYLVLVKDPKRFLAIEQVAQKRMPSAATLGEYQSARAALPADSNLMVFVSPRVYFRKDTGGDFTNSWFSMGVAVRSEGLAFHFRYPVGSKSQQDIRFLADTASLDANGLRELPAGAYGVLSYAQPGKTLQWLSDKYGKGDPTGPEISKFEKETGISLERDLFPVMNGDFRLAVYPGPSGDPSDVDFVGAMDNTHGNHVADSAEKLLAAVERYSAGEGKAIHFVRSDEGSAAVWRLDSASRSVWQNSSKTSFVDPKISVGKEPVLISISGTMFAVSSEAMANKVLMVGNSRARTLADDIPFTSMQNLSRGNSQINLMVSLNRILNAAGPAIESFAKDWDKSVNSDQYLTLFGGPEAGLVGTYGYDGSTMNAMLFLPLDWDKAIHLLGEGSKKIEEPGHGGKETER